MLIHKISHFYFLAFFLGFSINYHQKLSPQNYRFQKNTLKQKLVNYLKPYRTKISAKNYHFILSFLTGYKKKMPKKEKLKFKTLGLLHLFTPSGLHLSSLLLPLFFFIRIPLLRIFLLFIGLIICHMKFHFYSLNRIFLFYLLTHTSQFLCIKVDIKFTFLSVFVIDLILGSFQVSPLSWFYSFIFWGTLLYSTDYPKILLPFFFLFSGALCLQFSSNEIYPLAIPAQLILTSVFTTIFPFILIFIFTLPLINTSSLLNALLNIYSYFIDNAYDFISTSFSLTSIFPLCIIFLFYPFCKNLKSKSAVILFFCITFSKTINEDHKIPRSYLFRSRYNSLPKKDLFLEAIPSKKYVLLKFKNKTKCKKVLFDDQVFIKCRQSRKH